MRRLIIALSCVAMLAFVGAAASADVDRTKAGLQTSGFFDFADATSEFSLGVGQNTNLNCTTTTTTQPAAYAGNLLLDCDGEVPHNETSIVVDPGNPIHAVGAYHSYQLIQTGNKSHLRVVSSPSVTFDGGVTWREVGIPVAPYQSIGDPGLAFDANGKLYLSSLGDNEGQGGVNFTGPDIVVSTSSDGGLTWSKPLAVATGLGNAGSNGRLVFNDKPYITADANASSPYKNNVYLSWSKFTEKFTGAKPIIRVPITFSGSPNGAAWSKPTEISGFSTSCPVSIVGAPNECDLNQDSYPTAAPNGAVYVGFENFNTFAENQYMVVKSTNGGASFSNPTRVDAIYDINMPANADDRSTLTGCQLRWGAVGNIAADPSDASGNTVYAVWADNRSGSATATNTNVFLARSTNGGANWTVYPIDTSPNDQFYPWVAVSRTGRVDVGYMDRSYSSGQSVCQYGFSLTRVSSFSPLTLAKARVDSGLSNPGKSRWFSGTTAGNSRFIGDYNGVAVGSNGKTWSLWTDQRADAANAIPPDRLKGQHAVGAITP